MASKTNLSVVVDVGTSKLAAIAGWKNEDGKIEIAGMSKVPSRGIKRGTVMNIDEAADSVVQLLDELKQKTGSKISKVDISYAGQPVKILEHRGYRYTSGGEMVTRKDVDELLQEAGSIQIEQDYKILHVIPQSYVVDDEPADFNPVGITGRKIEAIYKVIIVPEIHLINFRRVFDKAGVELGNITLSPFAVSEAVLTRDEKEMGAICLDIGAGTTKLTVYHENAMIHLSIIPFGGQVITLDIKEGCCILPKWAEQLKIQYGQALGDFADERKVVTIPGHSGWEPKEISFKSLSFIIQARLEEMIDQVFFYFEKSELAGQLGAGIVISGGTSGLNNLVSLVKFRTGMDARLAFPVIRPVNMTKDMDTTGYLTALGLLQLTLDKADPAAIKKSKPPRKKKESRFSPWLKGVVQGVLDYVDDDDDVALK
ncbi:MAG: cell division protein FtsA [Mariniphaga sp.]|nr:cell division protein FtsA [Mariniphaga sp.]